MTSPVSFKEMALPGITVQADGSWMGDAAALASYRVAGSIYYFPQSSRIERDEQGRFRLAELAVLSKEMAKAQTGPFPVRPLGPNESILVTPFSDVTGDGRPDPIAVREERGSRGDGFTDADRAMLRAVYEAVADKRP
jgi:hypothetical protein